VTRPYEPPTPEQAEAKLDEFRQALDDAEEALVKARDAELEAENARDTAKSAALLDDRCPKTGVFAGVRVTVAERDAWVAREVEPYERDFRAARQIRRAAQLRFDKISKQARFQQSINSNARENYRFAGGHDGFAGSRRPTGR
jgi:hypothetical protein